MWPGLRASRVLRARSVCSGRHGHNFRGFGGRDDQQFLWVFHSGLAQGGVDALRLRGRGDAQAVDLFFATASATPWRARTRPRRMHWRAPRVAARSSTSMREKSLLGEAPEQGPRGVRAGLFLTSGEIISRVRSALRCSAAGYGPRMATNGRAATVPIGFEGAARGPHEGGSRRSARRY